MSFVREIANITRDASATYPVEELKYFTIPYGAFDFVMLAVAVWHFTCWSRSWNLWKPWGPKEMELWGPVSFALKGHISYKMILVLRSAASLTGSLVLFALSTYSVCKCRGPYRLLAVWKMLLACFNGVGHGASLYSTIRKTRGADHIIVGAIKVISLLAGPIVGLIGLRAIVKQNLDAHPSLRTLAWVLLAIGLTLVVLAISTMAIGSFAGREREISSEEGKIMEKWLKEKPKEEERLRAMRSDGEWGWEQMRMVTEAARRSSGAGGRLASIFFFTFLFAIFLVVLFERWYVDWMLGVVADNLGGVPHNKVLGIIYFVAGNLYLLF